MMKRSSTFPTLSPKSRAQSTPCLAGTQPLSRTFITRLSCSNAQSAIPQKSEQLVLSRSRRIPALTYATIHKSRTQDEIKDAREQKSSQQPVIHDVFEKTTGSWQYVVADPATRKAAIVDPVLDYNALTQEVRTQTADSLLALVREHGYKVDWILETHAHADHITAAAYLARQVGEWQGYRPKIAIGSRINVVQARFSTRYDVPTTEWDTVFDETFTDDQKFSVGNLQVTAIHTPGHTPDHMSYKIGDNVLTGDLIFYPDLGTARADFPGGDASQVWKSAHKILSLPARTRIWSGHDYPEKREAVSSITVQEHREKNKHLRDGIAEKDFIKLRRERDATLAAPKLIHQSLQMNIRGGRLPAKNDAGERNLHLPMKTGGMTF